MRFFKLHSDSLILKAYSDAAFATNDDLSSHLGYLILLTYHTVHCHFLDYISKNSKRVVGSIMGCELYAFVDSFDKSYMFKGYMERILNCKLPLHMLTNSKQLFDAMTKGQ